MRKIEKILFYVFIILIPFQIRFNLSWNQNEWNSFFVYLADFLFLIVLILAAKRKGFEIKKQDILLACFLILALISLFSACSFYVGIFRFLKLVEFLLLFFYIKSNLKEIGLKNISLIVFFSGVFQSVLAIGQFLTQKSLGIEFVEAGIFEPGMVGVANFIYNGQRIMRSYGSFSHPNVLAGFLLFSAFCFYYLWFLKGKKKTACSVFYIFCFAVLVFGLFTTFSRTAIFVFLISSLVYFIFIFFKIRKQEHNPDRILKGKSITILFLLFVVSCLVSVVFLSPYLKARFFTISLEEQAIDLRFFYNKIATEMIKEKPFLGVGVGNFVSCSQNYPAFLRAAEKMLGSVGVEDSAWIFQPVHNIYLLIAAEVGIFGFLFFLIFVCLIMVKKFISFLKIDLKEDICFLFFVSCFLILALTDHYFWTLQPGAIVFWLGLGIIYISKNGQ